MHELTERIRFYLGPSPKELDEADKWIRQYLSEKAKELEDIFPETGLADMLTIRRVFGLSPSGVDDCTAVCKGILEGGKCKDFAHRCKREQGHPGEHVYFCDHHKPSEVGESQTAHRCACGAEHLDKPKEVGEKVDSIMVGCYCDQCAGKQEIKGFHTFVPKPKKVDMQIMQKKKTMTSPTKPSARKVWGVNDYNEAADKWIRQYLSEKAKIIKDMHDRICKSCKKRKP